MARIENPTSKDLIVALNDMHNSWVTICNGLASLKRDFEAYGIHDWFKDALETQIIDDGWREGTSLGKAYDGVFVDRNPKTLKMQEFCEYTIDYIFENAESLQGAPASIKGDCTYKSVSNPNKQQVIDAFNVLEDSMYTFACGVGGYYGMSDSVEKDLGKDWVEDSIVAYGNDEDHPYYGLFSRSYDESTMDMMGTREGFEEYIKNGGKIIFQKSECKLKIRVHKR